MTQSELNQEWSKQRRRIRRFLTQAERRGFEFDYSLPDHPSKITKEDVYNLKSITPQSLYQRAIYVDQDTGEVISGTAGRTLERQRAVRKGISRNLQNNFKKSK